MSARIQAFVCLLAVLMLAVGVSVFRRGTFADGPMDGAMLSTGMKIDPNTADVATLQLLPGIGPGIAEHVVETRESGTVFTCAEDLEAVRFIGPSVVGRVRDWVRFKGGVVEQEQEKER